MGIVKKGTKDADRLISRIYNWKFQSALPYLEGQPEDVQELVEALANTVGNCGWGEGYLEVIIGAAADRLIGEEGK